MRNVYMSVMNNYEFLIGGKGNDIHTEKLRRIH